MNPIKLIRKLGKALRGGATSRQIFLGVLLGFGVGMTPGVNLTFVILLLLLVLMNVNGAMGAVALVLGRALCYALAPVTFSVGYALVHNLGLVALVRWMGETPVLALLDWHVYCLLGGLPFTIIIGGGLGWLAARAIGRVRRRLADGDDKGAAYRKVSQNKAMKLLLWIAFGKKKEDYRDMLDKKSPLFRKGRLIAGVVVLAAAGILLSVFTGRMTRAAVVRGIALANGAEVNVESARLSLLTGRLEIRGLQVTDPRQPTHNSVQADLIVADVSIPGLLTRRLVVDVLSCEQMVLDAERATPGEVYSTGKDKPAELPLPSLGRNDVENARKILDRVKKLSEYLKSSDPSEADEDARRRCLARQAKADGYLHLSAKDFLTRRPAWVIRDATIDLGPSGSAPALTLTVRNLSSQPSLHDEPVTFDIDKKALLEEGLRRATDDDALPDGLPDIFGGD